MMKVIIAGAAGLVIGGVGGYLACHFIEKAKIDKAISDGVQQTLDEIRGSQKRKAMDNENRKSDMIKTTGRNINPVPHLNGIDLVQEIAADSGYISKESGDSNGSQDSRECRDEEREPDGSPDDDSDLPFEMSEEDEKRATKDLELDTRINHSIWDDKPEDEHLTQEEYDQEQEPEIPKSVLDMDPKKPPYPITQDEYNNDFQKECEEGFWEKITLIFFKDNVFAERVRYNELEAMSAAEVIAAIGKDNMKKFVDDIGLKRTFVRNNKLHLDYEIVRSERSYSSVLHEDEEE